MKIKKSDKEHYLQGKRNSDSSLSEEVSMEFRGKKNDINYN